MHFGRTHFKTFMRFYTRQYKYYCDIDLHARSMYVGIMDQKGKIPLRRNIGSIPKLFLRAIQPHREYIIVAAECLFVWYWLDDLYKREAISFVPEYALYMKVIHAGKSKNNKIDSHKIAALLRGGNLPISIGVWCRICLWQTCFPGTRPESQKPVTLTPGAVAKNSFAISFFRQGDIFTLDKKKLYRS